MRRTVARVCVMSCAVLGAVACSTVTGPKPPDVPGVIRAPASEPGAIPWLLLSAKATFGKGVLTQTRSIQRVATKGGLAPTEPCTAANANQFARVPYTATYYFYRSR